MTDEMILPPSELRTLLRCDTKGGKLFWRRRTLDMFSLKNPAQDMFLLETACNSWNTRFAGKEALYCKNSRGYPKGRIWGKHYFAHRVIWAMARDAWPIDQIDHINGDPSDNRIANLRACTHAQNMQNQRIGRSNTSGLKGVSWSIAASKWKAKISNNKKVHYLGVFENIEDAHAAYAAAAKKLHGKFAKTS